MHKIINKFLMALSVAVLVSAFSACNNDKGNAQRFKDAAMQLDQTKHTFTDLYDYWPVCGIRVTGSHLASIISLEELEKMLPATTTPKPFSTLPTLRKMWSPTSSS